MLEVERVRVLLLLGELDKFARAGKLLHECEGMMGKVMSFA